ncbi:hypothetical protein PRUPE_6G166500, partial [Prunus persica]
PDQPCCRCCFSFIFTLGLTALFMWLSLRTSKPTCKVRSLYIPALNKTLNDTTNKTLYVTLRLENGNKDKGIYYDAINLNFTLPSFYQGHQKKATKSAVGEPKELNWTAVSHATYSNGTVHFRVDLVTAVSFKIMFWRTGPELRMKSSATSATTVPQLPLYLS